MKKAMGGKLNNDYSSQANRAGARWALALTVMVMVMVMSVSTFLMRTSRPQDDTPAMQKPAEQITAFQLV